VDSAYSDDHSSFKIALLQRAYEADGSQQRLAADYCEDIAVSAKKWNKRVHPPIVPDDSIESSFELPYDDRALVWVASHDRELATKYPNRWILVHNNAVIADDSDPLKLQRLADKTAIETPFITRVAGPEKKGKSTSIFYANKDV
jgi:hypothetical protein